MQRFLVKRWPLVPYSATIVDYFTFFFCSNNSNIRLKFYYGRYPLIFAVELPQTTDVGGRPKREQLP